MADKGLLPAYLMVGADQLKREFLVKRLTERISVLGDLDFNRDVFIGDAVEADELVSACNTLPFASEKRLVLVKDADRLPKAASEALISYLEDPCPTTVLALTAEKLAKNTRLYKAIAKVDAKAVVDCSPRSRKDLPAQVRDLALSEGVTITPNAAHDLIALVGESTVHLDIELKKMAAVLGKRSEITSDDVARLVARTTQVKPWEFVDALCERDPRKVALLLSRMTGQSPFGLLTMSLNRIRELLIAKDLLLQGRAGALASTLGMPDWRVRNHRRWADGFSQHELVQALVSAADLERAMKSGGDADTLFEKWALSMCRGSRAA